jgi:hypothetical protein
MAFILEYSRSRDHHHSYAQTRQIVKEKTENRFGWEAKRKEVGIDRR